LLKSYKTSNIILHYLCQKLQRAVC